MTTTNNLPIPNKLVDGWINVGILYPQCNVNVLLTDGKNIGFGYRVQNERYTHWKSHQDLGWITHWMPLPQPPKEIK